MNEQGREHTFTVTRRRLLAILAVCLMLDWAIIALIVRMST
jgi:hypothetical protein